MKKSLFFVAAASALMLTACSSENDPLQSAAQQQQTTLQDNAIGFDVYTPAATDVTRAGQGGTMTTSRLQRTHANGGGFGVYAYLIEDVNATVGNDNASSYLAYGDGPTSARTTPIAPNFMVNQEVLWSSTNLGWAYAPLKYWPNETDKDSQNTNAEMEGITGDKHLDRLTFFAYAPYVEAGVNEPGITLLTNKKGDLVTDPTSSTTGTLVEASVGYKAALTQPSSSVDLLWGVAPAGGLSYTAVNGRTVTVNEGKPLMDMTKPDVNTSMKFLFQHALARIGINVVAAIDQVGAGGKLDPNTKITVKEVTLTGKFGETGILNLDNPTANVAHWVDINGTAITNTTTALPTSTTLTLNVANGTIAPDLRYAGDHTFGSYSAQSVSGVTTSKKDLINGRYYTLDAIPAYTPARMYYNADGTEKHATYTITSSDGYYTETSLGVYTQQQGATNSPNYPSTTTGYYTIAEGTTTFDGNNIKTAAVLYTAETAATYNAGLTGAKSAGDVQTAATYYDAGSAATYNAGLTGAKSAGDDTPADYDTKFGAPAAGATLTAEEATAYNATLDGAKHAGDELTAAVLYTAETAATYNAGLTGAKSAGDVQTAATYGYPDTGDGALGTGTILYTRSGSDGSYVYTRIGTKSEIEWNEGNTNKYYTITPTALAATDIAYEYTGDVYDVERNYFMVVPTNNVKQLSDGLDDDQEKALRTVRVKIEYYVTTEDAKIDGGRTQTKNVIEKDVLFPSIANGKSYMLNLVLGLTSVKMEAEVDDWKVINVNADLPQNTGE